MTMSETFELTKFSIGAFKDAASAQSVLDWQHYRQPTLRMLFEKDHRYARLQIIWTSDKNASFSTQNTSKMLKLEDIDLLAIKHIERPFAVSTPRLNAVHKDHLVALRYLPLTARSCANSEYRRFQVAFKSPSEAARFVECIKDICPCNGGAPTTAAADAGPNVTQNPQRPSTAHTSGLQLGIFQSQGLLANGQLTRQVSSSQILDTQYGSSQVGDVLSSPVHDFRRPNTECSTILVPEASLAASTEAHNSSGDSVLTNYRPAGPHTSSVLQTQSQTLYRHEQNIRNAVPQMDSSNAPQDVLLPTPPSSSQLPDVPNTSQFVRRNPALDISFDNRSSPSAHVPSSELGSQTPSNPLFQSLRDTISIDHLAQDQLEKLIAEVVREDGFEKLLGKLDSMWHLKGLIGI